MVYTYFTYQDSMILHMIDAMFLRCFCLDVCWCLLMLHQKWWLLIRKRRRAEAERRRREEDRKHEAAPLWCCRRGPLSPVVVTSRLRLWAMCARSWRSCAGKLGNFTETWNLKLGESRFWHFLNIWNIYPNYSSSFWRWFFYFQIFQCFFLSLLALITVWASWCWFFCAASRAPHLSPSLNLHQNCLNIRRSIDIEQYRQYTIT